MPKMISISVRDVEDNVWQEFVSVAKQRGVRVGALLTEALRYWIKHGAAG